MRNLWNAENECLSKTKKGRRVVSMGNMNGRFGNSEVARVLGKWGVLRVNEIGKHLMNISAERGFLANSFLQHIYEQPYDCGGG